MIVSLKDILNFDLKGKVIVFETDTVYGIGCLLHDIQSVKRIYEIKNREAKKPMAILCANIDQVKPLVNDFDLGEAYAKKYWPGALTLIYPKSKVVDDTITSGQNTVGIRIPASLTAQTILKHFGPMVVTSLNLSNEPAVLLYRDALKFEDVVDYIVEGNDLTGVASTVFDPIQKRTLRQGEIQIL